jgi:signal transduction histidine kinase
MENKTKKKTSRFRVSDNGIGIPRSDLPFICKRFYRVKNHHSQTQAKGTGLRFPIVKRAIEADADTITAASTPEVKTIFTITGPLIEAPDESDEL